MNSEDGPIFNYLCRTCLHELSEASTLDANIKPQQWQSVFDSVEEFGALSIADLLFNTIPQLEVQPSDELPRIICHECLQSLLSSYRFQQQCLQSQQQILEMIAKKRADLITMVLIKSQDDQRLPEGREEGIILDNSNERAQTGAPDPLKSKSINDAIDNFLNSQADGSEFIKSEPCDYEPNSEYRDIKYVTNEPCTDNETNVECSTDQTMHSIVTIKDEIETDEEQVSLSSSESMKSEQTNKKPLRNYCDLCKKEFCTPFSLRRHKMLKHSIVPVKPIRFYCDICNCLCFTSEQLQLHRLTHESKEPLKNFCDICQTQFSASSALARHKKQRHSSENPKKIIDKILCDLCNKFCSTRAALLRHKQSQHYTIKPPKEVKRTACQFCGKSFNRYQNLRTHELGVHANEKSHLCPECGKTFKTAVLLINHRKRHLVKTHECPHCPLKFVCPSDASKHAQIHTSKTKTFICEICDARVSTAKVLRNHYQRHRGEKPYKCDYCEMRFLTGNHQRRHMLTHTGEKPYKCKYCGRGFAQKGDQTKHLRIHLGENVHRCKLCPLLFRFVSEMREHFATHKNEDPETREQNMKALKEEEDRLQLKFAKRDV